MSSPLVGAPDQVLASRRLPYAVKLSLTSDTPVESVTIEDGVPHHFSNDGNEDAVAIQEFRPALRTAEFFETFFELARRGELDERGMPSLLRLAILAPRFCDEIRVVRPPWPVQRAAYAVLAPFARARGYAVA